MAEFSNPFPSSGIASLPSFVSLAEAAKHQFSVETASLRNGKAFLSDILSNIESSPDDGLQNGAVISISGEPGTGKTHLLRELSQYMFDQGQVTIIRVEQAKPEYVEVFAESLFEAYSKQSVVKLFDVAFLKFCEREIVERVFLHRLSAAKKDKFFDMRQFLIEQELDVSDLVSRFISDITSNSHVNPYIREFSGLYISTDDDAYWDELKSLSKVLGVADHVNDLARNEASFLNIFEAIALLEKRAGRRIVLVVDESEKFFYSNQRERKNAFLKRLFELVHFYGHIAFLAGLPEFSEALTEEARQRVSVAIVVDPWSESDISEYIDAASRTLPSGLAKGFTVDAIRAIRSISNGNARLTLRLLHQVYSQALIDQGSNSIGVEDVRRATRGLFEGVSPGLVSSKIIKILAELGARVRQTVRIPGADKRGYADIVAEFGDSRPMLFVVLSSSLLNKKSRNLIEHRVSIICEKNANQDFRVAVVVNGYVSSEYRADLRRAGANRVIFIKADSYEDDLAEAFDELLIVAGPKLKFGDDLLVSLAGMVSERVEAVLRRQDRRPAMNWREVERISTAVSLRLSTGSMFSADDNKEHLQRRSRPGLDSLTAARSASRYIVWAYQRLLDASFDSDSEDFGVSHRIHELRRFSREFEYSNESNFVGAIFSVDMALNIFQQKIDLAIKWAEYGGDQEKGPRIGVLTSQFDRMVRYQLKQYFFGADRILLITQKYFSLTELDSDDVPLSQGDSLLPDNLLDRLRLIDGLGRRIRAEFKEI